jgi:uncharacterized protein YkwD
MADTTETNQEAPQAPEIPTPPIYTEDDKAVHDAAAGEDASISEVHAHSFAVKAVQSLSADQAAALKVHNDGRKSKGLQPLVWDNTLVQHAQQWANHLVQIDKMVHSTGAQRPNEGENLAWAWCVK